MLLLNWNSFSQTLLVNTNHKLYKVYAVITSKHFFVRDYTDLPTIPLLAENVRFFVTFPPFRFLT